MVTKNFWMLACSGIVGSRLALWPLQSVTVWLNLCAILADAWLPTRRIQRRTVKGTSLSDRLLRGPVARHLLLLLTCCPFRVLQQL